MNINGKIPPQALDFEETVLGAILLENDALPHVIGFLKPEMFYKTAHQTIYKAVLELFSEKKNIDMLTVANQLRSNNELDSIGGAYYITHLTSRVASSSHIEEHARIILEKYIMRECIIVANKALINAYNDTTDAFELMSIIETDLFNLSKIGMTKEHTFYHSNIPEAIQKIEKIHRREIELLGVPSGYSELDRLTNGFQKTDLIIIAARPGMGKTTFALNCAYNAAKEYGKKVAFFSLEMGEEQLTMKLLSMQSDVNLTAMRNGTLSLGDIDRLHVEQTKAPKGIIIEDTSALSINNLRSKARKLKQKHDIDMIVIDYLQLMTCELKGNDNREREISKISDGLKALAKELKIPVIALSQLSRKVEERPQKKPMLSDLRESGSIEQNADIVMFLWRPEYYKMNSIDYDGVNYSSENIVLIDIAKHRNGAVGDLLLNFYLGKSKFEDFNPVLATEVERETNKKGKPIF